MSLSPKITVRPGTPNQVKYGIMGRAVVELQFNGNTIVKLSDLMIKQSKAGKWYVQYPSEEDTTGKKDENGYPIRYPYYVLFPGESGVQNRMQLHNKIISECQNTTSAPPAQAPPQHQQQQQQQQQPMATSAPPVANVQQTTTTDDDLQWDLDM